MLNGFDYVAKKIIKDENLFKEYKFKFKAKLKAFKLKADLC